MMTKDTNQHEIYTNSKFSEIYYTYVEWESFEGCFSVTSIDGSWECYFHGGLEEKIGELSDKNQKIIESEITPQTLYFFLQELFQKINL